MLPKIDPTTTKAWKKLSIHCQAVENEHLRNWFINNPLRFKEFSINFKTILFDFSKNLVRKDTMDLLEELFKECKISEGIQAQFNGEAINETEKRAVLHTALRNYSDRPAITGEEDVMPGVRSVQAHMRDFSEKILHGHWKGYTGKHITDIVNIGIGGSDLGPQMVYEALKPYHQPGIQCHFVSNVDGAHISETLMSLDSETTLFIIASKTFTTQETLTNARSAREWFLRSGEVKDIARHFVAVSTNRREVQAFGIDPDNMFVFWDWVGGRYSLWSAIGLSLCCGLGYSSFEKLLKGAHEMDEHFRTAPFRENIPVLMAAIGVWNTNFMGIESEVILPYDQNLSRFAAYLQQANMESNGKSRDRRGNRVSYHTGPVIWGEPGTNGQHAFYQLIHQGTRKIHCEFIAFAHSHYRIGDHHLKLLANFFAQTEALMKGKTEEEVRAELSNQSLTPEEAEALIPFRTFDGNIPTTSILAEILDEETLGALISCYEHKIFVQGLVWNIYSYDQWGVELGKQLAGRILSELQDDTDIKSHDNSTNGLINHFKRLKR